MTPGVYIYYCATPMVAQHIASGMYGMIVVEPKAGLPKVDHEYYMMEGDFYLQGQRGDTGLRAFDLNKTLDERPDYVLFNGAVGSLTGDNALHASVGDTIRIFFGVGGPNRTSSLHVIGAIFDRVFPEGSLTSPPRRTSRPRTSARVEQPWWNSGPKNRAPTASWTTALDVWRRAPPDRSSWTARRTPTASSH